MLILFCWLNLLIRNTINNDAETEGSAQSLLIEKLWMHVSQLSGKHVCSSLLCSFICKKQIGRCIYSFIHLFSKHLFINFFMPGNPAVSEDSAIENSVLIFLWMWTQGCIQYIYWISNIKIKYYSCIMEHMEYFCFILFRFLSYLWCSCSIAITETVFSATKLPLAPEKWTSNIKRRASPMLLYSLPSALSIQISILCTHPPFLLVVPQGTSRALCPQEGNLGCFPSCCLWPLGGIIALSYPLMSVSK